MGQSGDQKIEKEKRKEIFRKKINGRKENVQEKDRRIKEFKKKENKIFIIYSS